MGLQDAYRADLVLRHETAVTHRVGAQDGDQSMNDGVAVHHTARRPSEHQREAETVVGNMGRSHGSIVPASVQLLRARAHRPGLSRSRAATPVWPGSDVRKTRSHM